MSVNYRLGPGEGGDGAEERRRTEETGEGRILRPLPSQKDDSLGRHADRPARRVTWKDGGQQPTLPHSFPCLAHAE